MKGWGVRANICSSGRDSHNILDAGSKRIDVKLRLFGSVYNLTNPAKFVIEFDLTVLVTQDVSLPTITR